MNDPTTPQTPPCWQFSLRTLLLLTMAVAVVCAISSLIGFRTVAHYFGPIVVIAALIWQLRRPGVKLDGQISVGGLAGMYAVDVLFFSGGCYGFWLIFAVTVFVSSFVAWLAFALIAIRTWRSPNRTIGLLSITFLLCPLPLEFLASLARLIGEYTGSDFGIEQAILRFSGFLW